MKDTNVLKLYQHMRATGSPDQLLYYDPGVGSPDGLPGVGLDVLSRKWERISGLASGHGVYENIREGYAFLIANWQPRDRIWIFGFSRGAFTARAISGMVNLFGLIHANNTSILDTLMRVYFSDPKAGIRLKLIKLWRRALGLTPDPPDRITRNEVACQIRTHFTSDSGARATVHFVGVWDTVESVGFPFLGSVSITSSNTTEGKRISHVRHALSLDEHRKTFLPRLYEQENTGFFPMARKHDGSEGSLRQIWFTGVHSDVGGGYARWESGLSDITLSWMIDEAIPCGLRCKPYVPVTQPYVAVPSSKQHDMTYTVPWWSLGGLCVRDVPKLAARIPDQQVEHPLVARLGAEAPSIWQERRSKIPVFVAMIGAAVMVAWQAYLLHGLARVEELALAQFQFLWILVDPSMPSLAARLEDASIGGAVVVDLLLIACYGYVLARGFAWAFHRMAGPNRVDRRGPWWQPLGMAPVVCVVADLLENALTLWIQGWSAPFSYPEQLVLTVLGLASAAKFVAGSVSVLFVVAAVVCRLGGARVRRTGVDASALPTTQVD